VHLTLDFYRRNCIEGLFLSSGIIRNPDYTMEQVVEVARVLREEHDFRGYIHLKTIPEASADLLASAGRYADRLSINVELPTEQSLTALAPEKDGRGDQALDGAPARPHRRRQRRSPAGADHVDRRHAGETGPPAAFCAGRPEHADDRRRRRHGRPGHPAGERQPLRGLPAAPRLLLRFSPIPDAARALPLKAPPLVREHRLYQADWLMRFYGFGHEEIVSGADGMLSLEVDPKLAWALAHRIASRSTATGPRKRCCCACPDWA
jgi:hypothetical protein